ncbi:MAG: hypothetical protein JWN25_1729 [Verrucomicrobiales bacterium]|nr:hypothetical protein [Verrucomicrobiales bacterium]
MNDEELKKLWQQQPLRKPELSTAQAISAMENKMSYFRRSLNARDLRELLACALSIIVFGFYAFNERIPIVRLGWLMVIGSTIFIAWKLVHTRRTNPPAPPGATIVESLRAELDSVRAQSGLLGTVLWWYLLPPGIGLLVATWGMPVHFLIKIPVTLFYFAIFAFIYRLNQRTRSKQLLPMEAQLESLLRSAETGQPLDEEHVTNLRPIVLSMAATDQVKPVEFKVAFWQIALYGEIGFIGIWFFVIFFMTTGFGGLKPRQPAPETVVQTVRAEETNRYSVVARRITDLLNANDFAAVQKLFNREMGKALPPEKASEFFTRLAANYGNIEKVKGPIHSSPDGWIVFWLGCQRGELKMSLALDEDDKIAGVLFRPSMSIGWLAPRIFCWQHLVLIVPFFLAGLLFSWLIQKTTRRAVGISALGIHLCGGQNLILWDEIKQVRPLRILNICSLWLVQESGEKIVMPWTSLEQHADLKAAVESFGPVNHPIRKFLPLLKRLNPK